MFENLLFKMCWRVMFIIDFNLNFKNSLNENLKMYDFP